MNQQTETIKTIAQTAKQVSYELANLDNKAKNLLLNRISEITKRRRHDIETANQNDIVAANQMVEKGELSLPLVERLKLTPDKINQLSVYLEEVARLDDPVGQKQFRMRLDNGLDLERISCPLGVVAIIFESRPEVVIQVTALSLKSGNAVILKGGTEAKHSNRILFEIIDEALGEVGLSGAVKLIETRQDVSDLLDLDAYIDLIIPRGSNSFVRYIQDNTKIPVLGHSSGICHLYIDSACDVSKIAPITLDAKLDYPSACNAVETVLIHKSVAEKNLPDLASNLTKAGVSLRGCPQSMAICSDHKIAIEAASEIDWKTEYTDLILAIKIVESIDEAISHINTFGSHHTDSIITEDQAAANQFIRYVDSACVFHNTSTRFSDGYVFGLGAEVGISTNKTHARGPVGLEGMIIYKYILRGDGHVKGDYSGADAKPFLHEPF